jgi:hypothetical protein
MSADRDVTRIVRSWLHEDAYEDADRILNLVLDEIDTTPQRRAGWLARRLPFMSNSMIRVAVAAAAVLAVIALGISLFARQDVGHGPASTPTPTARPTPIALPAAGARLAPGTYVIDQPFSLRVSLTVGDGWTVWSETTSDGAAVYKVSPDPPNGRGVIVVVVDNLYANPCDTSEGLLEPALGPSVDDLAEALAGQPNTAAMPIDDVTLSGYSGKHLEYTMTVEDVSCGRLTRFPTAAGPREALVNEHDQVWILDVDGSRLMIDAFSFPGVSPADLADLERVVESIQIEPLADASASPPSSP